MEVAAVYENISSQSMVTGLYTAAATSTSDQYENYHIQCYLASLKFYVGPTDGYLTSDLSKKAIKNFQKVYGLTETGEMDKTTKSKLNAAYTMKVNSAMDSAVDNLVSKFSLDSRQKDTLLNTWTFLRNGMGLNQK